MNDWEPGADRHDPWVEGMLGFAWMFTAALLTFGAGAVVLIALGTHLLIRVRPSASRVVNYDPSTVGSVAFIPVAAGVLLAVLYARRLARYRRMGA